MSKTHIIGGGIAGLAAAVKLKSSGQKNITLYESSKYLGGRCRSYIDPHLKITLDNGNHLILGCNDEIFKFLKIIQADNRLEILTSPLKIINHLSQKKVPIPYYQLVKFLLRSLDDTVSTASYFNLESEAWQDFFSPLIVSIQNTHPELSSAKQIQNCLRKIFLNLNLNAKTPYQPVHNLSHTFIEPALSYLGSKSVCPLHLLTGLQTKDNCINQLIFQQKQIDIKKNDRVIFALPIPALNTIFNLNLDLSKLHNPISNLHFKLDHDLKTPQILGLSHANAHWVFIKKDHISVTMSHTHIKASQKEKMIKSIWEEIRTYYPTLPHTVPEHKLIVEKYATLNQTPEIIQHIKNLPLPQFHNARLIGDWQYLTYPNTIEAAMRSYL